MKKLLVYFVLIVNGSYAQNIVCFTLQANPNSTDPALSVFTKYVDVYGFSIYAEAAVSDAKVLHAAAIAAELLDNNEDGVVDDAALIAQLIAHNALMPVFESDGSAGMNTFMNNYQGDGVSAVLWQTEMDPSQPGHWGSDATVEEILHTINHVGHRSIYSTAFDIDPNSSSMSAAMDIARAGQWITPPNTYPAAAWYHYDDVTCDYQCMAIEYMYWSIVSNMGILNDPQTCAGIANEWEPCSPTLFQSTDTAMYGLITDPQYKLPQLAPDGNYCPQGMGVEESSAVARLTVFPNPSIGAIRINLTHSSTVKLMNTAGQIVYEKMHPTGPSAVVVDRLPAGAYSLLTDFGDSTAILLNK